MARECMIHRGQAADACGCPPREWMSRRHRSIPPLRNKGRLKLLRLFNEANIEPYDRPQTRGDCERAARPCLFVACKHHLYLDVSPKTGLLTFNHPELEPSEMAETCSLDVADHGGVTLEEVGVLMNITRERVRQIEEATLKKARERWRE